MHETASPDSSATIVHIYLKIIKKGDIFGLVYLWEVCGVLVPQEVQGNAAQTWAEGEDYGRKKLFVALFHHDVMSAALSGHLIIILNKSP